MFAAARVPRGKRHASGAVVILGTPLERAGAAGGGGRRRRPPSRCRTASGCSRRPVPTPRRRSSRRWSAARTGRAKRASSAWTTDLRAWPSRSIAACGWTPCCPASPPPAGSRLGLLIGAAGAAAGRGGPGHPAVGPAARARSTRDNPMAITRPMGSGQRPHPPPSSRSNGRRICIAAHGGASRPAPRRRPGRASARPPPAMLETPPAGPGVTLGRYRLLERIGEGGMAEIFIAAAHGAEGFVRHFVVKRMHPHLARSRDAVNQFIDEGRLQSGLVHSNIVPVFDFGRVGEEYFLALEYIHGRDLERLVRRHVEMFGRSLSVPVAFYIMHEVLEALAYAHARDRRGRQEPGDRPPRRLAGKHPGVGARRGEAVGLRHRQGGRAHEPHRGRHDQGERQLHVPRAGARRAGRSRGPTCSRRRWSSTTA